MNNQNDTENNRMNQDILPDKLFEILRKEPAKILEIEQIPNTIINCEEKQTK